MVKIFKNLLLQNCPLIMKLGMEHYTLMLFESYMNDDPELNLSYFTTMSNSAKLVFCTYCRPRYQSIYRTIGPLVCFCFNNNGQTKNLLKLCNVLSHISVSFDVFTFVVVPNITDRVPKYVVNAIYPSPSTCPPYTTRTLPF